MHIIGIISKVLYSTNFEPIPYLYGSNAFSKSKFK